MRRSSLILLSALFVGLVGHGIFWFYHAYQAKQWMDHLTAMLKDEEHMILTHEGVKVSGYPFSYDLALLAPKLTLKDAGYTKIWEMDKLLLRTSLTMRRFTFYLPRRSEYVVEDPQGDRLRAHIVSENRYPTLTLVLASDQPGLFAGHVFTDWRSLHQSFESLRYVDQGYTVTDLDSNTILASTHGSALDLIKQKNKGSHPAHDTVDYRLHYALKGFYIPRWSLIKGGAGAAILQPIQAIKPGDKHAVGSALPVTRSEASERTEAVSQPVSARDIPEDAPRLDALFDARFLLQTSHHEAMQSQPSLPPKESVPAAEISETESSVVANSMPAEDRHGHKGVKLALDQGVLEIQNLQISLSGVNVKGTGTFHFDLSGFPIPVGGLDISISPFDPFVHGLHAMGYITDKQSVIDLWRGLAKPAQPVVAPPPLVAEIVPEGSTAGAVVGGAAGSTPPSVPAQAPLPTPQPQQAMPAQPPEQAPSQPSVVVPEDSLTFTISVDQQGHINIGPFSLAEYILRYYKAS